MSTESCYYIPYNSKLVYLVTTNSPKKVREMYDHGRLSHPSRTALYPENDRNGPEMQQYVSEVPAGHVVVTGSLYLYREFAMSDRPVMYMNISFRPGREYPLISCTMDPHDCDLEIVDRELEQSDRYLASQRAASTEVSPTNSPFECSNCGYRPNAWEVLDCQGGCPKCRGTVIAYTVDVAQALLKGAAS